MRESERQKCVCVCMSVLPILWVIFMLMVDVCLFTVQLTQTLFTLCENIYLFQQKQKRSTFYSATFSFKCMYSLACLTECSSNIHSHNLIRFMSFHGYYWWAEAHRHKLPLNANIEHRTSHIQPFNKYNLFTCNLYTWYFGPCLCLCVYVSVCLCVCGFHKWKGMRQWIKNE